MKMKIKSIKFFELTILVLLISIVSISAGSFGIGCSYSEENPLKLFPGENTEILINLQNSEEAQLKASILEGTDIAEFLEASDVYDIPNTGWVNAKLKISVPASASMGQEYSITMSFSEVFGAQAGTIGFDTVIEKSFKVVVVEKPPVIEEETPEEGEGISLMWWILGIVVVVIIIYLIVKRKRE